MNDSETLFSIEAIKKLKARYFRCIDLQDWVGFKAAFTPDAVFDVSDDLPEVVLTGADNIVASVTASLKGCRSIHHGHCPEIEITSDDTATGVWAMEDILRWESDGQTPARSLHGYGHYYETYLRIDHEWRIRTMKLRRLRVDHGVAHYEFRR